MSDPDESAPAPTQIPPTPRPSPTPIPVTPGPDSTPIPPTPGPTPSGGENGSNFVLYGVTGDGADTPESLFTIDITTAATTLVLALGNGSDGEEIASDGILLLHASGSFDGDGDQIEVNVFGGDRQGCAAMNVPAKLFNKY